LDWKIGVQHSKLEFKTGFEACFLERNVQKGLKKNQSPKPAI